MRRAPPPHVALSALAVRAFSAWQAEVFQGLGPGGFPWAARLLSAPEQARARLASALGRGCARNRSLLQTGYTYGDFWADIQDYTSFQSLLKRGTAVLEHLLLRREHFNSHLWACAPAVIRGLQLWRLVLLDMVTRFGVSELDFWNRGFREMGQVSDLLDLLQCRSASGSEKAKCLSLVRRDNSDWFAQKWDTEIFAAEVRDLRRKKSEQRAIAGIFAKGARPVDHGGSEHMDLLHSGKLLLESMRERGLLHSWVVARGTMIFAMRYGYLRGLGFPSGMQDIPRAPMDMDAYALTDDWERLNLEIQWHYRDFGFEWCGWHQGWPKDTLACLKGTCELEVVRASWDSAPSMLPSSRCLVREVVGPGASPGSSLELPCPREPVAFMRHLWRGQSPMLTACLPLPVSLDGDLKAVSEEDVRFLWQRAKHLHLAGYASMAPFFGACRGHPHAPLAAELASQEGRGWLFAEGSEASSEIPLLG